jgi:MFS family permease
MRVAAIRALFANRNYAIYISGNIVSLTGTWIQSIAFGWLIWQLTQSVFWVGVMSMVSFVPTLLAGLVGGVMADRMDRFRLTATTQIFSFALTFGFFILYELGWVNLAVAMCFRVLLSISISVSQPARMTIIPTLVEPHQLASAVSFGSMVFNTARFIGPAIAALTIAAFGLGAAFLLNALSFLTMCLALAAIRIDRTALNNRPTKKKASVWTDFGNSFGYVANHGGLGVIFLLAAVTVICVRPISDFLPATVDLIFGKGVESVAILTSSLAGGSILGGVWAAGRDAKGLVTSALLASGAYACCIVAFMWIGNFWLGCGIFALAGFFTVAFMTAAQTLIQTSVDDEMRGRVLSLWFVLSRAGPDIGAFSMGIVASGLGLQVTFTVGALLCIGASLLAWHRRATIAPILERVMGIERG